MHNGFVRVDDEKMSKSLGNFFTVRDVLPRLRPEVLRSFLLAQHYRAPINYTDDNLRQADAALQRLYLALRDVEPAAGFEPGAASREFAAAMDDDFNTPVAIAALQSPARELNVAKTSGDRDAARGLAAEVRHLGGLLGLLGRAPDEWLETRSALSRWRGVRQRTPSASKRSSERIAARIEARRREGLGGIGPDPRRTRRRRDPARGRGGRHDLAAEVTKGTHPFIFVALHLAEGAVPLREMKGCVPFVTAAAARTPACSSSAPQSSSARRRPARA